MGKPKQWSPTDPKYFEGKTRGELEDMLIKSNEFINSHPKFEYGWHNEYRHELKRRIAEMIGKRVLK